MSISCLGLGETLSDIYCLALSDCIIRVHCNLFDFELGIDIHFDVNVDVSVHLNLDADNDIDVDVEINVAGLSVQLLLKV